MKGAIEIQAIVISCLSVCHETLSICVGGETDVTDGQNAYLCVFRHNSSVPIFVFPAVYFKTGRYNAVHLLFGALTLTYVVVPKIVRCHFVLRSSSRPFCVC